MEGFALKPEHLFRSSEIFDKISNGLNVTDTDFVKDLIWGDSVPRDYKLYTVREFASRCNSEDVENLRSRVTDLVELYSIVAWDMPTTLILMTSAFEIYLLLTQNQAIYTGVFILVYGFIYFVIRFVASVVDDEISEMDLTQFGCLDPHWYVQL